MFLSNAVIITRKKFITLLLFAVCFYGGQVQAAERYLSHTFKPNLGQSIKNYVGSIVSPDGSGLPAGKGSVAKGKVVYNNRCANCHGADGQLSANPLAGGVGSLATARPLKTVGSYWPYATTLFDYVARAMPYNEEKSLSVSEVYSVTAYLLNLNGILNSDAELTSDNLSMVKMPNKDGFVELLN